MPLLLTRLGLPLGIAVTWGAALLALYLHPAFWALFALTLALIVHRTVRSWMRE